MRAGAMRPQGPAPSTDRPTPLPGGARPQGRRAHRHVAGRATRRRRPEEHRERHRDHRRRQRRRLAPPRPHGEQQPSPTSAMASTARRYDSATQEFVDAGTFWVDVECWGELGGNVVAQHQQGRPGDRPGRPDHARAGRPRTGASQPPQIRAYAVGPNLARGTADFKRTARPRHRAGRARTRAPRRPGRTRDCRSRGTAWPAGTTRRGTRRWTRLNPADLSQEPAHV